MSPIMREWLVHGCLNLSEKDVEESLSQKIRTLVSEIYGGNKIGIRSWPQRGFRDTLWWYEKSEIPSTIASYFLKVDNQKSPNLFVGVSVEKGYEDKEVAQKKARERKEPIERWLLSKKMGLAEICIIIKPSKASYFISCRNIKMWTLFLHWISCPKRGW